MTEIRYSDFSNQVPVLYAAEGLFFSGAPVFEVRIDFLVRGSRRRVRLRSVDEREHILLEHDAYINNSKREAIIF
jgi:hypothetical protein